MKERLKVSIVLIVFLLAFLANLPKITAANEISSETFEIRSKGTEILVSATNLIKTESSQGYNYTGIHWESSQIPVQYFIGNAMPLSWRTLIQQCFQTWEDIPESQIAFNFAGITNIGAPEIRDNKNVVSYGNIDGQNGVLARCTTWFYTQTKLLVEADIVFDSSENWSITTTCPSNAYDLKNAATHEIGHTLSLGDLTDPTYVNQTMYAYTNPGEINKRTLESGDIAGASFIYPSALMRHDLAIKNITMATDSVIQGETVQLNVTFENEGNYSESLTASLKANETVIASLTNVFLANGASLTVLFNWDTNTSIPGNYQIACYLNSVPGETDIADNTYIDGTVEVKPQIHNLAVADITTTNYVSQNCDVYINVTIQNIGNQKENFEISFYVNATDLPANTTIFAISFDANATEIGNLTIPDLPANTTIIVNFLWNTRDFETGNYTLSSQIRPVPGEINTFDNALTGNWILIESMAGYSTGGGSSRKMLT